MNGSPNENENEFVYFFITHHENRQWLYSNTFYHMPKNWRRPNEFDPQKNRKMAYKNGLRHTRSHTSPSVQYIYWNLEVKHVKQLCRSITMDLSSDNLPCPPWLSLVGMSNTNEENNRDFSRRESTSDAHYVMSNLHRLGVDYSASAPANFFWPSTNVDQLHFWLVM